MYVSKEDFEALQARIFRLETDNEQARIAMRAYVEKQVHGILQKFKEMFLMLDTIRKEIPSLAEAVDLDTSLLTTVTKYCSSCTWSGLKPLYATCQADTHCPLCGNPAEVIKREIKA